MSSPNNRNDSCELMNKQQEAPKNVLYDFGSCPGMSYSAVILSHFWFDSYSVEAASSENP